MTLSPTTFTFVSELVRRESGIVLQPGKEYLVEARLTPLAREAGLPGVDEYVATLQAPGALARRGAVVEALTTNETSWFRDHEPFGALTSHVIPELLRTCAHRRRISIWSAACSSGQEAYSIAMLMAEHVLPLGWSVDILATDIADGMLERTKAGRYSQLEVSRGMPAALLVKHFQKVGTQWQVSPRLRSMVRVQKVNLATVFPPLPVFDIVFLRNVLIYFDADTKRSILGRTRQVLTPTGYLFLGGAETTLGIDEQWSREPVGRFTLHRPLPAGPATDVLSRSAPLARTAESR